MSIYVTRFINIDSMKFINSKNDGIIDSYYEKLYNYFWNYFNVSNFLFEIYI